MYPRLLTLGAILVASLAFLLSRNGATSSQDDLGPYIQGRNKTVLFLANAESGLANVHLATTSALLENHPDMEIHYASFPSVRSKLARISRFTRASQTSRRDVTFHELKGPSYSEAFEAEGHHVQEMVHARGSKGLERFIKMLQQWVAPWDVKSYMGLVDELSTIIDEVDPAVVVLDTFFRPAIDITKQKHRLHAVVSPNMLFDNFIANQPYGGMLWKFPAVSSGFQFPLPLRNIPENIWINFNVIRGVLSGPELTKKRKALRERGLRDPIDFTGTHHDGVPWISMETEGASIPVDLIPTNVTCAGPMVLDAAPASEQDAQLAAWLKRAPTVLINLGSIWKYDEPRAVAMAAAVADVLSRSGVQVIWKFKKFSDYSDDYLSPLTPFIEKGRLKVVDWLPVDPASMLNTGDIVASVHHGGSNCYHEAVLAGVPHVVLPLWADLYAFGSLVENLGIGVWGCMSTSPDWTPECISRSILNVVSNSDDAVSVRNRAKALGTSVQAREKGRDISAREIAKLAYTFH